jgi:hypothetical protein
MGEVKGPDNTMVYTMMHMPRSVATELLGYTIVERLLSVEMACAH